jgi:hypothetical protein
MTDINFETNRTDLTLASVLDVTRALIAAVENLTAENIQQTADFFVRVSEERHYGYLETGGLYHALLNKVSEVTVGADRADTGKNYVQDGRGESLRHLMLPSMIHFSKWLTIHDLETDHYPELDDEMHLSNWSYYGVLRGLLVASRTLSPETADATAKLFVRAAKEHSQGQTIVAAAFPVFRSKLAEQRTYPKADPAVLDAALAKVSTLFESEKVSA